MKTIYTTHLFDPHKIVITSEQEDLIQEARERVYKLAIENNWRPSIEIDLPEHPGYQNDEDHHTNFIVKVAFDTGKEDNAHQKVLRILKDKEPRGFVKADLGCYSYEGWESAIEHKDLSELPEVWFENMFINGFLEPEYKRGQKSWEVLAENHQRKLIPVLYKASKREIKQKKENFKEDIPYLENIAAFCKEIWIGKKNFSDLVQICEGRIISMESENSGGKEKE